MKIKVYMEKDETDTRREKRSIMRKGKYKVLIGETIENESKFMNELNDSKFIKVGNQIIKTKLVEKIEVIEDNGKEKQSLVVSKNEREMKENKEEVEELEENKI